MTAPTAAKKPGPSRDNVGGSSTVVRSPERGHNLPVATTLPKGVLAIGIAGYAGILAAFWFAFGGNSEAAFVLVIVSLFALMYFGLPYLMNRTAAKHGANERKPQSTSEFLMGDFDTFTGRISGWSAFWQYAFLPVALAFGALAIGIIMMSLG
jgi:hypothetical protein